MDTDNDFGFEENADPVDNPHDSWEVDQYESEAFQIEYIEQPEKDTIVIEESEEETNEGTQYASDEFNVELFLKHICNYPYLYNNQKQGYSNRLMRDKAWDNIARSMEASIEFCKAKWKSLREKYNREKQKANQASMSGAAANSTPPWEYMSFFQFMFDTAKPRETVSSFHSSKDKSSNFVAQKQHVLFTGNASNILNEIPSRSNTQVPNIPDKAQPMNIPKQRVSNTQVPYTLDKAQSKAPMNAPKQITTNKRKAIDSPEPTFEVLRQISSSLENVSKIQQPDDKINSYIQYLAAELRELPKSVQEEFMDSTMIKLLQLKRNK